MSTKQELADEMNARLSDLFNDVSKARTTDASSNEIQRKMDKVLIDWSGRLTEERELQLTDSRRDAEAKYPEVGPDATPMQERDRARLVSAELTLAEPVIKDQISQLRDGMILQVQHIDKGRAPDRVQVIDRQLGEDQKPETAEELVKKQVVMMNAMIEEHRDQSVAPTKKQEGR